VNTHHIVFFARTAKCLWSILRGSSSSHNSCATIGRLQQSQCNMLMIRSRVVAKSAGSGEPVFTSMGVFLYVLCFETADFKTEKRVRNH
jgi:hypothetical protein